MTVDPTRGFGIVSRRIDLDPPSCWSINLYLFSHITTALLGLLLAPKGIGYYWKTHYTDKIYNFHGLYRWNAFDTALLIPYFVVMIILAFYGIHRYQLVWLYFKNKKNAAKWNEPPMRFASWSTHETGSRFRCWTIRTMRRLGWPRRSLSGMRAGLPGWLRNRLC